MTDLRLSRCLGAQVLRWRSRPVVGRRLGLVAAALAVVTGLLFHAAGVVGGHQLGDVLRAGGKAWAIVAFCLGAWASHDAQASGMAAADRSQVGKPAGLYVVDAGGAGLWCAVVGTALAVGVAVGFLGALAVASEPAATGWGWVAGAVGQIALGGAAAAMLGTSSATSLRSGFLAIGAFFSLLVVVEPVLAADRAWLGVFLAADNLMATASGQVDGLTSYGIGLDAARLATLVTTVAVVTLGAGFEPLRDAPLRA